MGANRSGEEHNVQIIAIDRLAPGDVVRMEDSHYAYHFAVTSVGEQVIADAWRHDFRNPTLPNGALNWEGLAESVALCGSYEGIYERIYEKEDKTKIRQLVPINPNTWPVCG